MGRAASVALGDTPDAVLAAVVSRDPETERGRHGDGVVVASAVDELDPASIDCIVDMTIAEASVGHLKWAAAHGIDAVVGVTGFSDEHRAAFARDFTASHCLIVPNFAIGAVMMMRLAELAAPWFDTVEIIELHHNNKRDAPSGTARATASRIAAASSEWDPDPTVEELAPGARGAVVDGIPVHSVRMRGLVAHQEIIFGAQGQALTIRHDSIDHSSFMPGVLLSVSRVRSLGPGVSVGLDAVLGQ
jgi:4-hydroxy-tetrahydrodipicolinate reductase